MNNELRDIMQRKAVEAVMEDRRVIVEWGTGVGKSRTAVGSVERLLRQGRHRILLLVVERIHKENWRREFTSALGDIVGEDVFSALTVECYASLNKYAGTDWDLVIADEAHHLRSEARTFDFCSITAERVLCLSATLSDRHDADALLECMTRSFGEFRRFNFSLQNAIDAKILAEPRIFVHVLRLRDFTKNVTVDVDWGSPRHRREADTDAAGFERMWQNPSGFPHMKLHVTCNPTEAYGILDTVYESCKHTSDRFEAKLKAMAEDDPDRQGTEFQATLARNRMLQYALKRKNLLGSLKTGYAAHLLRFVIGSRRCICFCSSIEQGTELGATQIIHSKRAAGENERIMSAFQEGGESRLFAVGMAQEGANLPGIEVGMVIQLDSKERKFVQEFGRAMRSTRPEQHILVFNGTRDVAFLKSALNNINSKYIKYVDARTGRLITSQAAPKKTTGLSRSASMDRNGSRA